MTIEEAIANWKRRLDDNNESSIRLREAGQGQLAYERFTENLLIEEFINTLKEIHKPTKLTCTSP